MTHLIKTSTSGEHLLELQQKTNPLELESAKKTVLFELEKTDNLPHTLKAAEKFGLGLDSVTDVLLILVLKFGRATSVLIAIGGLLIVCLLGLVISLVNVAALSSQMADIQLKQEEIARLQVRIETKTTETKEKVDSTEKKIVETQEAVGEVVNEAAKKAASKHR